MCWVGANCYTGDYGFCCENSCHYCVCTEPVVTRKWVHRYSGEDYVKPKKKRNRKRKIIKVEPEPVPKPIRSFGPPIAPNWTSFATKFKADHTN